MKLDDVVKAIIDEIPQRESDYFNVVVLMIDYCDEPKTLKKMLNVIQEAVDYEDANVY